MGNRSRPGSQQCSGSQRRRRLRWLHESGRIPERAGAALVRLAQLIGPGAPLFAVADHCLPLITTLSNFRDVTPVAVSVGVTSCTLKSLKVMPLTWVVALAAMLPKEAVEPVM